MIIFQSKLKSPWGEYRRPSFWSWEGCDLKGGLENEAVMSEVFVVVCTDLISTFILGKSLDSLGSLADDLAKSRSMDT